MTRAGATVTIGFPPETDALLDGLIVDPRHGRLTLAQLPTLPPIRRDGPTAGAGDLWPGGVASAGGRTFWIDQTGRRVEAVDCDGTTTTFGCGGRSGQGPLTGLTVTDQRLYVAEHDDGRVVAYDIDRADPLALWSGLDRPMGLAATATGEVYVGVADAVHRLEVDGSSTPVAALSRPHSLAVEPDGGPGSLLVAAGTGEEVGVYRLSLETGEATPLGLVLLAASAGEPSVPVTAPLAVGRLGPVIVVAIPARGVVLAFDAVALSPLGPLGGPQLAVVALAPDPDDVLWVTDGRAAGPCGPAVPVERGRAVIGPIPLPPDDGSGGDGLLRLKLHGRLHPGTGRVSVDVRPTGATAGVRAPGGPAVPSEVVAGRSSLDDRLLVLSSEATEATATVELTAGTDRSGRPVAPWLDRIELRVNEPGPIEHLPQIYRSQGSPQEFLDPFLRLLGSGNDDVVSALLDLPDEFDPATATDDLDGDRWLDWLATWVDAAIDESWSGDQRRRVVAEAFEANGRRGTAEAIRHRIELELGVEVQIVEPGDLASIWVLGEAESELGLGAMLGAAPAEGSIVDHTATVDRSHLIGPGDLGAPLFGDLAHRFTVVAPPRADPDAIAAVVEREKPAHTRAHVCPVEPGIELGLGGTVGIDLIIGDTVAPTAVDGLDGFDRPANQAPARLGEPDPETGRDGSGHGLILR